MKEKGFSKGLIERLKRLYEGTLKIRIEKGSQKSVQLTKKGQGCMMNPFLFNLYLSDVNKYL